MNATYRLQVRPSFDLSAAADVCDYLATLGVDTAYLSPILPSAHGSDHGYDVVAFDTVDPQRGGVEGWHRFLGAARTHALSVLVDIVPNHTGVADPAENRAWWDVLRLGRGSAFARWFDIDWSTGRLLLPVLGDDFRVDQLTVVEAAAPDGTGRPTAELRYFEHRFPLAVGTEPTGEDTAADVHDRQHYRLVNWRRADTDQNYRRFFAVTTLAGLRVEDEAVFHATHEQIIRWLREDEIAGLRIDHPDGLADPLGYFCRLRNVAGPHAWLLVEKILETGEQLPPEWPVDGTTGYDALAEVSGAFIDPAAEPVIDSLYRELTGDQQSCAEHVRAGKRQGTETILQAELSRLARLAPEVPDAAPALRELLVAFPVYRSYLPTGRTHLDEAVEAAVSARPELEPAVAALHGRLADPDDTLAVRFQQTSGAVMAKGVEDTAFYRYTRFLALNEVGGDPARFGCTVEEFHRAQWQRQESTPRGMTTASTHDTKRGEDVRARLAVLAELPEEWGAVARELMTRAPLPDLPFAYLLWQTVVGAGFVARERMHAYVEKAMREAATSTNWTDPDAGFEAAVHSVVERAYDDPAVHTPLAAFIERLTPYGWSNALSQKLVQLTMPGVPDVYQGTELWEDSLVDPDNRRPVDFDARRRALDELDQLGKAPPIDASGRAKLWVVSRALRLRRDRAELFSGYAPLLAQGPASEHVLAFDRGGVVTVTTRLPVGLERDGGWRDTVLDLDGPATDVLTGRQTGPQLRLTELLDTYPVALLVR